MAMDNTSNIGNTSGASNAANDIAKVRAALSSPMVKLGCQMFQESKAGQQLQEGLQCYTQDWVSNLTDVQQSIKADVLNAMERHHMPQHVLDFVSGAMDEPWGELSYSYTNNTSDSSFHAGFDNKAGTADLSYTHEKTGVKIDGSVDRETRAATLSAEYSDFKVEGKVNTLGYEFEEDKTGVSAWLGKVDVNVDTPLGQSEGVLSVGKVSADYDADFNIFGWGNKSEEKKDGTIDTEESTDFISLNFGGGVTGSVLNYEQTSETGSDMLGLKGETNVDVLSAEADARVKVSVGTEGVDAYASGSLMASGASADQSVTFSVLGLDVKVTGTAYAGAVGVEGKAGIDDNKFVLQGGAAAGLGASATVEVGLNEAGVGYVIEDFNNKVEIVKAVADYCLEEEKTDSLLEYVDKQVNVEAYEKHTLSIGKVPDANADRAAACQELNAVKTPQITSTNEELNQYAEAAKKYVDTESVSLTYSQKECTSYSAAAEYLHNNNENPQLAKDNVTQADYNVLSELAYARKYNRSAEYQIVAGMEGMTVQEYCDALIAADARSSEKMSDRDRAFLVSLRNNTRYNNLTVDHADGLNTGKISTQVITLSDGDGHAYIGIQGTNGTVIDWCNDSSFAKDDLTEEELWINSKIKSYLDEYNSFDLTGHSQGGRDAVSCAMFLSDEHKDKLRSVVTLDGPGYSDEFLKKYGGLLDEIKGKTTLIVPADSYVGHIFKLEGVDTVYVKTYNSGFAAHELAKWMLNSDGSFVPADVQQSAPMSRALQAVVDTLSEKYSGESLERALSCVFYMLATPEDAAILEFEVDDLQSKLSTLSADDLLMLVSAVATVIENVDDITLFTILSSIPYLLATDSVSLDDLVFAAGIAVLVSAMSKCIIAAVVTAKIIAPLLRMLTEYKTKMLQAEREAYKAGHSSFHMNSNVLLEARACLEYAETALNKAERECDGMWNCFNYKDRYSVTVKTEDGGTKTSWHTRIRHCSVSRAISAIMRSFVDLAFVKESPYVKKGIPAIDRILAANTIANAAGLASNDSIYGVSPSLLSTYATNGQSYVKNIMDNMQAARDAIDDAGSIWQAEDYTSLKDYTGPRFDDITAYLQGLEGKYGLVSEIADAYDSFQNTAISEFQSAAN